MLLIASEVDVTVLLLDNDAAAVVDRTQMLEDRLMAHLHLVGRLQARGAAKLDLVPWSHLHTIQSQDESS